MEPSGTQGEGDPPLHVDLDDTGHTTSSTSTSNSTSTADNEHSTTTNSAVESSTSGGGSGDRYVGGLSDEEAEAEARIEALFRSVGACSRPNETCEPLIDKIVALLPPTSSMAAIERNGVGRPQTLIDAPPRSLESIETWAQKLAVLNTMRDRFPELSERRQAACMMNPKLQMTLERSRTRRFEPNALFNQKLSLFSGSITTLRVDAIVNAANALLLAGGGVCGAIHSVAGPALEEACIPLGPIETGQAVVTPGFGLPAKYVIHVLGPVGGEQPLMLRAAYRRCLELTLEHGFRSLGLVCVSTGKFGYPIVDATHVALETVRLWMEENVEFVTNMDRIIFCTKEPISEEVYEQLMDDYFPQA